MTLARRQLLKSLVAASLFPAIRLDRSSLPGSRPLHGLGGNPDWPAIRDLFPLAPDWTHLSSFLFVSHPKPVAEAIDHFRKKLDSDALWIEIAACATSRCSISRRRRAPTRSSTASPARSHRPLGRWA